MLFRYAQQALKYATIRNVKYDRGNIALYCLTN